MDVGSEIELRCGMVLKNRIAKAPMTECIADPATNLPDEGHQALYARWSQGGAGMLITGNVQVDRRYMEAPRNVAYEPGDSLEPFTAWAAACGARGDASGCPVVVQLAHAGRQTSIAVSAQPVAPSAVPLEVEPKFLSAFNPPRALTSEEMEDAVERFAVAAGAMRRAGFGGVQIHAAHGYFVAQTLSPRVNKRTDKWGGSAEKRRSFLMEAVAACQAAIEAAGEEMGADATPFILGVKLNSSDFQKGGFTEEESLVVLEALETAGCDFVEISGGTYENPAMMQNMKLAASTRKREGFFIEFAGKAKDRLSAMPLMVSGGMRTLAGMNAALSGGAMDIVGVGRPFCLDPDFPRKMIGGEIDACESIECSVGVKFLDGPLVGLWYERQIERISRGLAPDPNLSFIPSLTTQFLRSYIWEPKVRGGYGSVRGVVTAVVMLLVTLLVALAVLWSLWKAVTMVI